ncbi:MAG TPA: hypothetical protein PLE55_03715, partial [Clostridiales bacterium]|nr:hypothetical protein [Clostridiales bacterium]
SAAFVSRKVAGPRVLGSTVTVKFSGNTSFWASASRIILFSALLENAAGTVKASKTAATAVTAAATA